MRVKSYHFAEIQSIAAVFVEADEYSVHTLGKGNINDTYLVTAGGWKFVLQRINERVFPEPERVARNTARICAHLQGRQEKEGRWRIPRLITSRQGGQWYRDDRGSVWRAQSYIDGTKVIARVEKADQAREAGSCLGRFHALVADLDPEQLEVVLPGFHDLPGYLKAYDALSDDTHLWQEKESHRFCRSFIEQMRDRADFFTASRRRSLLSGAIVHGDPKISNILFDCSSGKAAALIDLDTVGPGFILQDIGDGLRSCCCTAEDALPQEAAVCDLGLLEAYLRGYLKWMCPSEFEQEHLFDALLLITFELGLRFFTDYLEGNVYFKAADPEENLRLAMGQFRLARSIAAAESSIRRCIDRIGFQPRRKTE